MKIYLSPSAQPANLYAVGDTTEQIQCNRIAEYAKTALERCGFEVKKAPEGQDYKVNVTESNYWGADIHVPIHTNAGGGHGPIVFIYSKTVERQTLGKAVYDAVNDIVPTPSKYGVQVKQGLYEVSHSIGKCVYVECAFHDDKKEAQWIIDNVEALGEAIAKGICEGTGTEYIEPISAPEVIVPETPDSYASKACAKAVVKGIFLGDGKGNYNWKSALTRQDVCVVLERLGLL